MVESRSLNGTLIKFLFIQLRKRLANSKVKVEEDMAILQKLKILIDYDDNGYLLQVEFDQYLGHVWSTRLNHLLKEAYTRRYYMKKLLVPLKNKSPPKFPSYFVLRGLNPLLNVIQLPCI